MIQSPSSLSHYGLAKNVLHTPYVGNDDIRGARFCESTSVMKIQLGNGRYVL